MQNKPRATEFEQMIADAIACEAEILTDVNDLSEPFRSELRDAMRRGMISNVAERDAWLDGVITAIKQCREAYLEARGQKE